MLLCVCVCEHSPRHGSFLTRNSSRAIQPPPTRTMTVLRRIRTRRSCWESPNWARKEGTQREEQKRGEERGRWQRRGKERGKVQASEGIFQEYQEEFGFQKKRGSDSNRGEGENKNIRDNEIETLSSLPTTFESPSHTCY